MEGTIRTMTQRRGAYRVRRVELDWYMVGCLVLLACMLLGTAWLCFVSPAAGV